MIIKWIKPAIIVLGAAALLFLYAQIATSFLTSESIKSFLESSYPAGALTLIAYVVLAHVAAPLAGAPAFIAGVAVFGIWEAMFYIYIGSMISSAVNFYISRRWGRNLVMKVAGKKTMHKIDQIVGVAGTGMLIGWRVFGLAVFEEVSYAAGLTNMRFKNYFIITAFASIIPHFAFAYFFQNADFAMAGNLLLILGLIIFIGFVFSFVAAGFLIKK